MQLIEVCCAECEELCSGYEDLLKHILLMHHEIYTPKEAVEYAELWLHEAQENREMELSNYYADRELDKAIERDAFPDK